MSEKTRRVLKFVAWFVGTASFYWLAFYMLLKYGGRYSRKGLLYDSELIYPVTTVLALGIGAFIAWRKTFWRAKQSPEKLREMHERELARRDRRKQYSKYMAIIYLGAILVMLAVMIVLWLDINS